MQSSNLRPDRVLDHSETVDKHVAELDSQSAGGRVIRGSLLRVAAYIIGVLLSVVSARLMFDHLGVVNSGRFVTVTALIGLLIGLSDAGLVSVGVREYSVLEARKRERLIADISGLRLVLALAGLVVAMGFVATAHFLVPDRYTTEMLLGTGLASVGLLLTAVQGTLYIPLQALIRNGSLAFYDLLKQVLTVVAIIACVVAGFGLAPMLAAPIPAGVVVVVALLFSVRRLMPLKPHFSLSAWRAIFKDVIAVTAATALNILYYRLAMILMSLVAEKEQAGYFSVSYRLIEVLIGIPVMMVGTALPILARSAKNDQGRLNYAIERLIQGGLIAGIGLALAVGIGADFVVDISAGDKFVPSASVLQLQAPVLIATFLVYVLGFALLSLHKNRQLMIANGCATVFVAVGVLLVAPSFGANGVALVMVAAECLLAGIYWLMLRGSTELCIDLPAAAKVVLIGVVAAAVGLLLPFSSAFQAAGAVVSYVALLLLKGAVPQELKGALVANRKG